MCVNFISHVLREFYHVSMIIFFQTWNAYIHVYMYMIRWRWETREYICMWKQSVYLPVWWWSKCLHICYVHNINTVIIFFFFVVVQVYNVHSFNWSNILIIFPCMCACFFMLQLFHRYFYKLDCSFNALGIFPVVELYDSIFFY